MKKQTIKEMRDRIDFLWMAIAELSQAEQLDGNVLHYAKFIAAHNRHISELRTQAFKSYARRDDIVSYLNAVEWRARDAVRAFYKSYGVPTFSGETNRKNTEYRKYIQAVIDGKTA